MTTGHEWPAFLDSLELLKYDSGTVFGTNFFQKSRVLIGKNLLLYYQEHHKAFFFSITRQYDALRAPEWLAPSLLVKHLKYPQVQTLPPKQFAQKSRYTSLIWMIFSVSLFSVKSYLNTAIRCLLDHSYGFML